MGDSDKFEKLFEQLGCINNTLISFQQQFNALKAENQSLSNNITSLKSDIKADINTLRNDLKILNVKNAKLHKQQILFDEKISHLNSKMREYEQVSHANRVRLTNIPYSDKENIFSVIKTIGDFIECSVTEADFDFLYRLKVNRFLQSPPIIIKFVRKELKIKFFNLFWAKRELVNTNLFSDKTISPMRIYISEDLGRETYRLFRRGKELQREGKIKSIWTRQGRIFIKKEEGSQPTLVRNEEVLTKYRCDSIVDLGECSSLATGEDETETDELLLSQESRKASKKRKIKKMPSNKISRFLKPTPSNVVSDKSTLPSPITITPSLPFTTTTKANQATPLPKNDSGLQLKVFP